MVKKVTKKKNRRLRRQIRKTVGCLLMASAVFVAALPVPEISAKEQMRKVEEESWRVVVKPVQQYGRSLHKVH